MTAYIVSIYMLAGINMIAVMGLSIFTGFTGVFSLGHAAFVAVGAYISGVITYYEYANFYVALIAGMVGASLASLIIGIPTLRARLRSDYFAIAILGYGEVTRLILENSTITNGARGMTLEEHTTPVVLLFSLAATLFTASSFLKSRYGAACIAIREDSIAAEMSRVNLFRTRLLSLVMSAAFCGLSGGLLAHYIAFIQPNMFTLVQSTMLLAAVVAGGIGSLSGPMIASFLFIALPEALRVAEMWRLVAYGLLLILIMVYRPQGLMGYRELTGIFKSGTHRILASMKRKHGTFSHAVVYAHRDGALRLRVLPNTTTKEKDEQMEAGTELLKVKDLSHYFGGINAIDSLTFEAKSGIVTGIIGPNGAGKTTVFNLITGVYKPTRGEILFNNQNCAGLRPDMVVRKGISRTFQNIRLFKRCTCLENVLTPILQRKDCDIARALIRVGKALRIEREATEEAMSILSVMGLANEAKRSAGTLPYGLQRKLEMARAVASSPQLLLLDEPAAGMNPEETLSLVDLISEVRQKFNLTILLIEHHMDLVMNICTHIVVMESGRLLFRGTPYEVRHNEKVIEAYLGKSKTKCLK